jgi:hypothetical protein
VRDKQREIEKKRTEREKFKKYVMYVQSYPHPTCSSLTEHYLIQHNPTYKLIICVLGTKKVSKYKIKIIT